MGAALPPARLPQAARRASALRPARPTGAAAGMRPVRVRVVQAGLPGRVDRLAGRSLPPAPEAGGAPFPISAAALGSGAESGQPRPGRAAAAAARRLAARARLHAGAGGDVRGSGAASRDLLQGGRLAVPGADQGARPRPRQQPPGPQEAGREERFTELWRDVIADVVRVATEYDREWIRRRRKINTLLVVLFVFRPVFAPDRQGYAATLHQVWEQCRQLELPLPSARPVAASSICDARAKVRDQAFRDIHRAILARPPANRRRPVQPRQRARRRADPPARPAPRRCRRLRPRLLLLPDAARPRATRPPARLPPFIWDLYT